MTPTKSGRDEIPARVSPSPLFFLSKSSNRTAAAVGSSAPAENPIMPILFNRCSFSGVFPHKPNGLESVVYFVRLRIITIAAQTAPQDDGVDSVVIESGTKSAPSLPTFNVDGRRPPLTITAAPVFRLRSTVWISIEGL